MLAIRSPEVYPTKRLDLAHLEDALEPCAGEVLTYRAKADPAVLLRPFYAVPEGEIYYLYLDPVVENRVPLEAVTFSAGWNVGAEFRYGNSVGLTAECAFEGTGIRWLGYRFDDGGRAEVTIDGAPAGIADQYGPGRGLPFDWQIDGLAPGRHVIALRLLEEKNTESKDRYLNVAGFEVIPWP
ncbi:MAG: hypothetical protein AB1726_14370 [Planctomycetota bacterium]